MSDTIQGTFHFHSTYSHDGRSTLAEIASTLCEQGYSFCIMTEHFEDFDAAKFDRYVEEAQTVSQSSGFLLIPGAEVNLLGLDTVVFPVREYAEVAQFASNGKDSQGRMFKVVVHPSKYPFDALNKHLEKYDIDGVELWNQQADSNYLPPVGFLELVKTQPWRDKYRYFFGCDIHNAKLKVANVLEISAERTTEAIVSAIRGGNFTSKNLTTAIEYQNAGANSFDAWMEKLQRKARFGAKLRRTVRRALRSFYKMLPRNTQHSLNDFKNFVRNKV